MRAGVKIVWWAALFVLVTNINPYRDADSALVSPVLRLGSLVLVVVLAVYLLATRRPKVAAGAQPPPGMPVPGWYGDPSGRYPQREWDGEVWTAEVLDESGNPGTDPLWGKAAEQEGPAHPVEGGRDR